jgi:hypothetical protein
VWGWSKELLSVAMKYSFPLMTLKVGVSAIPPLMLVSIVVVEPSVFHNRLPAAQRRKRRCAHGGRGCPAAKRQTIEGRQRPWGHQLPSSVELPSSRRPTAAVTIYSARACSV